MIFVKEPSTNWDKEGLWIQVYGYSKRLSDLGVYDDLSRTERKAKRNRERKDEEEEKEDHQIIQNIQNSNTQYTVCGYCGKCYLSVIHFCKLANEFVLIDQRRSEFWCATEIRKILKSNKHKISRNRMEMMNAMKEDLREGDMTTYLVDSCNINKGTYQRWKMEEMLQKGILGKVKLPKGAYADVDGSITLPQGSNVWTYPDGTITLNGTALPPGTKMRTTYDGSHSVVSAVTQQLNIKANRDGTISLGFVELPKGAYANFDGTITLPPNSNVVTFPDGTITVNGTALPLGTKMGANKNGTVSLDPTHISTMPVSTTSEERKDKEVP